ncbi:MAG: hypothetical protein WA761_05800, partial [Thermoplasmata archaeon]
YQQGTLSILSPVPPTFYPVSFTEAGLPSGSQWSVTLNGTIHTSTVTVITFTERNGTYAFTAGAVAGYGVTPPAGNITVSGSNESQSLVYSVPVYPVPFTETGLTSGTSWEVTVNGTLQSSTTSEITFAETNGSYAFTVSPVAGWSATPSSGEITINGPGGGQTITFIPIVHATYGILFDESGLPPGTGWNVSLDGIVGTSNGAGNITFTEPNGTYPFTIVPIAGYLADPSTGNITVLGDNVTQSIAFSSPARGTYVVTFSETGLAFGALWSVSVAGVAHTSTTSAVTLVEPNGTYSFTLGPVSGFIASPGSGSVTVAGLPVDQPVTFERSTSTTANPNGSSTFLGLPAAEGYALLGVIAAAIILSAVVAILLRRRGKAPPDPHAPSPTPGTATNPSSSPLTGSSNPTAPPPPGPSGPAGPGP